MSAAENLSEHAEPPLYTLHSINGVTWAAVWGSALAAGIVLAINYWKTGRGAAARYAIGLGTVLTAAITATFCFTPDWILDRLPFFATIGPQVLLVRLMAVRLQGGLLTEHGARQGRIAPVWRTGGVGLLCGLLMFSSVFGVVWLQQPSFGIAVKSGKYIIFRGENVTEPDVDRLAKSLDAAGYPVFDAPVAHIKSSDSRITVSFFLNIEGEPIDSEVELFRQLGTKLVLDGFSTPLTVQLCNESFDVKKVLIID